MPKRIERETNTGGGGGIVYYRSGEKNLSKLLGC